MPSAINSAGFDGTTGFGGSTAATAFGASAVGGLTSGGSSRIGHSSAGDVTAAALPVRASRASRGGFGTGLGKYVLSMYQPPTPKTAARTTNRATFGMC